VVKSQGHQASQSPSDEMHHTCQEIPMCKHNLEIARTDSYCTVHTDAFCNLHIHINYNFYSSELHIIIIEILYHPHLDGRLQSADRYIISVCNQPPRSTQLSTLRGIVKWASAWWMQFPRWLQAGLWLKRVRLVQKSAATWRCYAFITWTGWTLAMTLSHDESTINIVFCIIMYLLLLLLLTKLNIIFRHFVLLRHAPAQ